MRKNAMMYDPLYFPRSELAEIIAKSLYGGITHAFTLFAPRRMGKTQFLLKDIKPTAEAAGFNVFYFSFMDSTAPTVDFQAALLRFAESIKTGGKVQNLIGQISKIEIMGSSIERRTERQQAELRLSDIIADIAGGSRPSLLLLDEIQELARQPDTGGLIRSLRTGLDIHQQQVKTIFTGSSTNGLRAMFNDIKAPFFHFAHALDFPTLGREFTDFLAGVYQERTGRGLDGGELYRAFERLNKTPLYMRAMLQDMIINPDLSIGQAESIRLEEMHKHADTAAQWRHLSLIEQLILSELASGQTAIYSAETRQALARVIGVDDIGTSTVQNNIRKLERKDLITRDGANRLQINSPILKTWILENVER